MRKRTLGGTSSGRFQPQQGSARGGQNEWLLKYEYNRAETVLDRETTLLFSCPRL